MPTCPEPAEGVPTVLRAVEKLNILSTSIGSVIPEGAKSACGGESRKKNSLLDTPSTSLRVVSPSALLRTVSLSNGLSNHGSRLRLVRYDVWGPCQDFPVACLAWPAEVLAKAGPQCLLNSACCQLLAARFPMPPARPASSEGCAHIPLPGCGRQTWATERSDHRLQLSAVPREQTASLKPC